LPPFWASIPSDSSLYSRPPPYRTPVSPIILQLGPSSSCPCPSGRTFWDPFGPRIIRSCRVYTLLSVYTLEIELQPCPTCPPSRRRFIGPDLRELGVFNFNNGILISHELLDEYTSEYTSSETPFVAWVGVMARRYALGGQTFMGDDLFRSVWFAYASLLALDGDMGCSQCGNHPETIICDGVTLAFGRKHLKESLCPPTLISPSSIVRDRVKYQPHQQLLRDPTLRKHLRLVLNAPKLPPVAARTDDGESNGNKEGNEDDDEDDEEVPPMSQTHNRASELARQHLSRIDFISNALELICPELKNLFIDYFGVSAYVNRRTAPECIRNLFRQVGHTLLSPFLTLTIPLALRRGIDTSTHQPHCPR
jgi:CxC4 like cysteine cluster associated with KDZ transposases